MFSSPALLSLPLRSGIPGERAAALGSTIGHAPRPGDPGPRHAPRRAAAIGSTAGHAPRSGGRPLLHRRPSTRVHHWRRPPWPPDLAGSMVAAAGSAPARPSSLLAGAGPWRALGSPRRRASSRAKDGQRRLWPGRRGGGAGAGDGERRGGSCATAAGQTVSAVLGERQRGFCAAAATGAPLQLRRWASRRRSSSARWLGMARGIEQSEVGPARDGSGGALSRQIWRRRLPSASVAGRLAYPAAGLFTLNAYCRAGYRTPVRIASAGLHGWYVSGGGIQSPDRDRLIGTWNVSVEIVLQT
ncbi:hypothetical protein C2845_PM07G15850 [Panicum miliaceum]|uniref:Uncharacterized protein n=1 Tax=Panicum miliaceum TaxID=4540 RepID=A0A3L6SN95_PANMI|nr:hypothetical protein C2845_PM07G15850 [Panicum miliaceum]